MRACRSSRVEAAKADPVIMKTASIRQIERKRQLKAIVFFISFILSIPRRKAWATQPIRKTTRSGYSILGETSPSCGFAMLIPPASKSEARALAHAPHSATGPHIEHRRRELIRSQSSQGFVSGMTSRAAEKPIPA
jgi:hypothetical protein